MSLLPPASNIVITGGSFVQNNDATKELKRLYKNVAPNAILNAGGRADPVRCHPGTREEVIAKIEKWITVTHADGRGIFWLSGPAGAGKSAIMQTIAERCIKRKAPMANFFFFRADSTRNHSGPVAATLLFQLFKQFPALRTHVAAIASENPVIFRQSLREQFSTLIEAPLLALRPSAENTPLVILIDGLDECSSQNGKEDQTTLLDILRDIATRSVSPAFIVLVASRTESHLTMAFNRIGCHPDSIYLDASYRPSDDIRVFLIAEFLRIKSTHSLRDILPANWPTSTDLDAIIEKSSGQFVYAATVVRFISDSAASPKRSLEIVLGLRLATRTSPFATLDSLYTYILSQADDWSSVRDILAAQQVFTKLRWFGRIELLSLLKCLGYTDHDILSSLSDLTAIIRFHAEDKELTIYHASLNDFLSDKHRAGDFYIDMNVFACKLVPTFFPQMMMDSDAVYCGFEILGNVTEPDTRLTEFLKSFLPDPQLYVPELRMFGKQPRASEVFTNLYESRDPQLHKCLVNRWEEWFSIVDHPLNASKRGFLPMSPQPRPAQASRTVSEKRPLNPSTWASSVQERRAPVAEPTSLRSSTPRSSVRAPHTISEQRSLHPSGQASRPQGPRIPVSKPTSVRPSTPQSSTQAPSTASGKRPLSPSSRASPAQRRRVPVSEPTSLRPSTTRSPAQSTRTTSERRSLRLSARPSPAQASHNASSQTSQRPSTPP